MAVVRDHVGHGPADGVGKALGEVRAGVGGREGGVGGEGVFPEL